VAEVRVGVKFRALIAVLRNDDNIMMVCCFMCLFFDCLFLCLFSYNL